MPAKTDPRTTGTSTPTSARPQAGYSLRSYSAAEELRKRTGLDTSSMAGYLGVSEKTYMRRAATGSLEGGESLKVGMLDEILAEATRVFRDEQKAIRWIQSPIISLDNQRPIDHLTSIPGYERVKETLTKIEYGMY